MRLIQMEASGFRTYREVHLNFPKCGHVRICGDNGVGKSTIIESLRWTLFGRLRTGSNIREATHRGQRYARVAGTSSQVWLSEMRQPPWVTWTLEIQGDHVRISRWNGGAKLEQYQRTDGPSKVMTGSQQVTDYIVKRLGINYSDLRATAWCLQGDVMRPVTMAKQDRKYLIRRLLLGNPESSAAVRNRDSDLLCMDADARKNVKDARREVENARSCLNQVIKELKCAEKHESEARRNFDELQKRWKDSLEQHSRHKMLLATIDGLERERDGIQNHLEDCGEILREMRGTEDLCERFDPSALGRVIARLEEDLAELNRLGAVLQDTRDRRLKQSAGAKIRSDWYADLSETLASAIAKGQCSACERRIWRERSTLTEKLDHAKAEAKQFRLLSARTNIPGKEETKLSDDIRQLVRKIDRRQDRVSNLQYERGYCDSAELLLNRIPSQVAKHADLERRLNKVVRSLKRCRQALDANGYRDGEHETLDTEVNNAERDWRVANKTAKDLRKNRDQTDRDCWELAQNAVDTSAEAVGVSLDEEKVRSELANTMTEIVKNLVREGGSQPTFVVSVNEDFKPTLHEHDQDGPKASSGGLNVMIALAMRLALLKMMKKRSISGKDSSSATIILDEPFGNVDSKRAKRFRELLIEDTEGQVLEIASASHETNPGTAVVYTVESLDDGNSEMDRSGASR